MATGRLAFERAGAATVVREAYAESPLRFLTPRGSPWVYTTTLGGGLVDGDSVELAIDVGAGARAHVTSQGPTRVFRSSRGCSSVVRARVAEGATLLFAPEPAACFGGARFAQRTAVELHPSASLALWDIVSAGRDRWGFSRLSSALSIRRGGETLVDETILLDAAHGALRDRLGRFGALATLVLAGPATAALRTPLDAPLQKNARVIEAASDVREDAAVVRLAAVSVEEMLRALRSRLAVEWRSDASYAA